MAKAPAGFVKGGTGGGRKRPLNSRPKNWVCPTCGTPLKKHWLKCPHDGTPRPDRKED